MWRKGNPPTLLVGMYISAATMENSMEVPQKTENRVTILSGNPTLDPTGHISGKNSNSKRYMQPNVHCSIIYNSQDMEATTDRRMDKEDVVYVYNGIITQP